MAPIGAVPQVFNDAVITTDAMEERLAAVVHLRHACVGDGLVDLGLVVALKKIS